MFLQELAATLRSRRKLYNLTQQDFADLVGVTERTIRAMEKAEDSIKIGTYLTAASTLGITLHLGTATGQPATELTSATEATL